MVLEKQEKYSRTLEYGIHYVELLENPKKFHWSRLDRKNKNVLEGSQIPKDIQTFELPESKLFTKNKVPVSIKTTLYYKVTNPHNVVYNIDNLWQYMELELEAAIQKIVKNNEHPSIYHSTSEMTSMIKQEVSKRFSIWGIEMLNLKFEFMTSSQEAS